MTHYNTTLPITPSDVKELVPVNFELRDYQVRYVRLVIKALAKGEKPLLCLPTGGGKTFIFSLIAKWLRKTSDLKVLLVAHREELIKQAWKSLEAITGETVGVIKSGFDPTPEADIQVATIQTLNRRPNLEFQPDLIIYDEAHRSVAPIISKVI